MKTIKRLTILFVTCVLLLPLTACTEEKSKSDQEVEMLISEFEYACQTLDVDAVLDCMDPEVAKPLESARMILRWGSTTSDELVMEMLLISLFGISDDAVMLDTLKVEIQEMEVKDTTAEAGCTLKMEKSEGMYQAEAKLQMIKDTERAAWYITNINVED